MNNYKEKASKLANIVNSGPLNQQGVCDAFALEHRTLQQNFTRLCFAWIKKVATDPCYGVDDRNMATLERCKTIHKVMSEIDPYWDELPYI